MSIKENILDYVSGELHEIFAKIDEQFFESVEEIRLRANLPIIFSKNGKEYYLKQNGEIHTNIEQANKSTFAQINKTMELMSDYSMYAMAQELKNGYLTLLNGHRVGICGKTVWDASGVKTIKNISGLNIRISHEILGCADEIIKYIATENVLNTMIISPPGCGKTTLLRDLIRQISDGKNGITKGQSVCVVDERSEICGSFMGLAQNDVGQRTDILDACPKDLGMMLVLRAMKPSVIAVDEIGTASDFAAIESVLNAGVSILCTIHGQDLEDVKLKKHLETLLANKAFKRFVILSGTGVVKEILNEHFEKVYPI